MSFNVFILAFKTRPRICINSCQKIFNILRAVKSLELIVYTGLTLQTLGLQVGQLHDVHCDEYTIGLSSTLASDLS